MDEDSLDMRKTPTSERLFWLRCVGLFVDVGINCIWPCCFTVLVWDYGHLLPFGPDNIHLLMIAEVMLPLLVYCSLMECAPWQGTLGKLATGLKVTDKRGWRITLLRSLARSFCKFLGFTVLLVSLGSSMPQSFNPWSFGSGLVLIGLSVYLMAETEENVSLHDAVAGTRVAYRQEELPVPPTHAQERGAPSPPRSNDIAGRSGVQEQGR